jgi:hypothetical protein
MQVATLPLVFDGAGSVFGPFLVPSPPGTSAAAVSVSLRAKRRLSDVDVERARLLHQYALDRASADAQRLADLQYAGAALVEAQEALL